MNVVIYARYSSDRQTEQSIEGQIKVCTAFANFNGYNIIDTYIDRAMTGKNDDRPGLQRLIEDSRRRLFQGVLVYAVDRFGRNLQQSVNNEFRLRKNGVRLISATENFADDSNGDLQRNIMMSFAQYYSDELSKKVKRGMIINAEKCQFNGGTVPLGYKNIDKRLVVNEETAPIVRKIFEMYANGSRALDIANYLNARQIRTASGAVFNKNSLHSILKNKKYIGVYKYANVEIEDAVPRIISDELFYRVAEILERNKKNAGHNKAKVEYLLTTKLFCGHCRSPMVGVSAKSKTGRIYYYYSCNSARIKLCHKKNARKEKIEDLVIKKCRELLTDDNIKKIAKAVSAATDKAQDKTEQTYLKRKLKEIDKAIENLMRALETGQNVDLISERITAKRKERNDLEAELAKEIKNSVTITEPEIRFFLTALKAGDINDIKYRRTLITIFVNSVYLYDDRMTIVFNAGDEPAIVDDIMLDEIEEDCEDAKSLYSARFGSPGKELPYGAALFLLTRRFESSGKRHTSDMPLPPVQSLVATIIPGIAGNADESPAGHQEKSCPMGRLFFCCHGDSNHPESGIPVICRCHQCNHWWLQLFPALPGMQTNLRRVTKKATLLGGFFSSAGRGGLRAVFIGAQGF